MLGSGDMNYGKKLIKVLFLLGAIIPMVLVLARKMHRRIKEK